MINYLKLVRYPNLLIVAATQYLMRYAIIGPILAAYNFELQFSNLNFALLVLSTVFLTAAGYVINDYFDTKTDILNRPDTVVVGKSISRRAAMKLHTTLNVVGVVLGIYLSWRIGFIKIGLIFMIIAGILWFYSTTYKRQFLVGNLIVAVLTALVPFMVVLFELPMLRNEYQEVMMRFHSAYNSIFFYVCGFSFFAFVSNLIREVVKDMEDFEGDVAYGRNTVPIILGAFYSKVVLLSLIGLAVVALLVVYFMFLSGQMVTLLYFGAFLIAPFAYLGFLIARAQTKDDYSRGSLVSKIIMLFGLLYAFVVAFTFSA